MIRSMVRVYLSGQMVENTLEHGIMVNRRELGFIFFRIRRLSLVSGRRVKELDG